MLDAPGRSPAPLSFTPQVTPASLNFCLSKVSAVCPTNRVVGPFPAALSQKVQEISLLVLRTSLRESFSPSSLRPEGIKKKRKRGV